LLVADSRYGTASPARPFRTGAAQKLPVQPKRDFKMRSFLSGYLIVDVATVFADGGIMHNSLGCSFPGKKGNHA